MNVTGNMTREYLSMSEAAIPHILFTSLIAYSGFAGGGGIAGRKRRDEICGGGGGGGIPL